ncbi:general transcriptional corepressor trfA-like isoform X3 [Artemia franciscana]
MMFVTTYQILLTNNMETDKNNSNELDENSNSCKECQVKVDDHVLKRKELEETVSGKSFQKELNVNEKEENNNETGFEDKKNAQKMDDEHGENNDHNGSSLGINDSVTIIMEDEHKIEDMKSDNLSIDISGEEGLILSPPEGFDSPDDEETENLEEENTPSENDDRLSFIMNEENSSFENVGNEMHTNESETGNPDGNANEAVVKNGQIGVMTSTDDKEIMDNANEIIDNVIQITESVDDNEKDLLEFTDTGIEAKTEGLDDDEGEVIADSILQQKNDTKTFWENKMIANSLEKDALSPPPGFDDPRADTPISQTSSGSVPLVDVPDDSFISVGDLLPEEEPKKNYMCHDESEEKMNYEESESLIEIAKNTDNPTETFIEKEIRMQKQREKQILAERELAVKNLAIASGKTSVSTTKTIKTINKPNLEFPRSDKHKSAEVLISQEIEDYKRREEELKLRQNLSSSRENLLDDQFASITTTDEGHYSDNDNTSEERESREDTPQNLQKSQSLESLSSGHSSGDVPAYPPVNQLADIKRRRVVVKPFDDGEEPSSIPTFQREQKETPIEREIRLAKEREEELRKNRHDAGIPSWSAKQVKKPEVTKVNGINLKNSNRGVQQHLAASRIQAEINEITEKENELRKAGKIYTTSEETVDEKVQRLSHLAEYSSELQQSKEARKGTTLSRAVSTPQLNTEPDHPRFAQTRNLLTQASFQNQLFKKSLAPPACTNQRGLMQKFINSRGKSTSMSVSSPEPTEPVTVKAIAPKASAVLNQNVTEKFVAKEQQEPPVLPTAVTQKPPAPRRHFLTAEEKIQEEMKEMQRREEELKIQRMRFLGRSQPDLSEFGDGEPLSTKIEDTTPEPPENDTDVVTRRPSHAVNAITAAAKNQRRKSHLIAEWENRIQQS